MKKVLLPMKDGTDKEFELDISLAAQLRWEAKFPDMITKYPDFWSFSEMINKAPAGTAKLISEMKILYCYFITDMKFVEFLQLFDMTDIAYIDKLSKAITECLSDISNSSSEKN